ncbi:hypothetical protein PIB30_079325 [Stylosanthes scabra]|uniref:Uncharacterized protein n=1 Tax=Stylosanthes scabra TaxID=79078 RepID=A0ABU6TQN4_9FABA|nr:hypothetical protein [Stylosanthes scabra]
MGGTELISMPLTLRLCQQWGTLNETDSIRCKVHYWENDPSPVLGIFKLGCISVTLSKLGNHGPDKVARTIAVRDFREFSSVRVDPVIVVEKVVEKVAFGIVDKVDGFESFHS